MAGSSRLHTLAASMIPAASPQSIRRVAGSPGRRSRNTPAAPAVVQSVGSRSPTAQDKIGSILHSSLPPVYAERKRNVKGQRAQKLKHSPSTVWTLLAT